MKYINIPQFLPPIRKIALIATVAAISFTSLVVQATPYATSLTNNAGEVSFRLNQTTGTNDTVLVISSGGTVTNILQTPANDPANLLNRGLIKTNLGIAAGPFQVRIKHVGAGIISTNSPRIAVNSPRGIAVNNNTNSPYFGWVYLANSAAGTLGDGMFIYGSDMSDVTGQGTAAKSGGYNFGTGGASAPYHCSVSPDDTVLVTDWSDASGGVISLDPLLTSFTYVLQQIPAGGAVSPVGSNNVHGSISSAVFVGTGANRKLYTMDEDYQSNPASTAATEWNSVWEYDIGNNPLPWSNAPNRKIMSPFLTGFAGQNQKCDVVGHYLYSNQRRSNPPQHSAYITDLNNLQDPSTFTGNTPWGNFWASQDESLAEGYTDDVLRDTMTIAVSPDGKWFGAIIAAGSGTITAPDGSTFANTANDIVVIPMTNGVPNLPARQVYRNGGASFGRDLTIDAAHNIYFTSSGGAYSQSLDIGETTDVTTGSDGTFSFATPPTAVSVSATTPIASETGPTPGVITITRSPEDLGNPVTVFYNITGSATLTTDYTVGGGALITSSNCVIAAGQTSTNITITPVDDAVVEPTETVVLTVKGSGGYTVGFPLSATVVIADNETPQLQITGLSTNVYQGTTNDYVAITLRRLGQTNVSVVLDASSFAFGGTAVSNVDYVLAPMPITIPAGVVNFTTPLLYPGLNGSTGVGKLSILVTNLAGGGYTVTNNTAASALQLKAVPDGTVLFSDDFEIDSSANYKLVFASFTNNVPDYAVQFGYDYAAGDFSKNLPPIPAAPHSTNGDTHGLYMTVNKADNFAISSALNVYLKNHDFNGNYALRFDMYLVRNSIGAAQSMTEAAMFGINHDGNHTNWFRNAVSGTDLPGNPTASDGLWFDIGADGSSGSGSEDFGFWTSPTYTNGAGVIGPTNYILLRANAFTQVFKNPPYDSARPPSGSLPGGAPANTILSSTPTWAEVEVSQVQTVPGNLITWKINNTVIGSIIASNFFNASLPNNNIYTNGTIMLGYDDPWDDIGGGGPSAGEGCVIFDNVRVVALNPPTIVTQPSSIVAPRGITTNLSVVATTTTGVTNYQWRHAGTNLPAGTNATLTFTSVTNSDYGTYSVVVSDGAYSTQSSNAVVVPSLPGIVTQPISRAAVLGSTISPAFSVVASTTSGVTNYQWYSNSVAIAGRTAATLSLTNVQAGSFTPNSFFVTVSDGFNPAVTSSTAQLTYAVPQTITNSLSGSQLTLQFGSEFGPGYVVEYKTNLTDASWKPLKTNAGSGGVITVTDSVASAPTRYYRVRLQ